MAVRHDAGHASLLRDKSERRAGQRDNAIARIAERDARQIGNVRARVADDGDGIDAAQIVDALIPGGQIPQECTARNQFRALRSRWNDCCVKFAARNDPKFGVAISTRSCTSGLAGGVRAPFGLQAGEVSPHDQPAHAEGHDIDLRNLLAVVVGNGVQELPEVVGQRFDGLIRILRAVIEKIDGGNAIRQKIRAAGSRMSRPPRSIPDTCS